MMNPLSLYHLLEPTPIDETQGGGGEAKLMDSSNATNMNRSNLHQNRGTLGLAAAELKPDEYKQLVPSQESEKLGGSHGYPMMTPTMPQAQNASHNALAQFSVPPIHSSLPLAPSFVVNFADNGLGNIAPSQLDGNYRSCPASPSSPVPNITLEQFDRWNERFEELQTFKREYGHCCVPSYWPQNNPLAQWVKRQRYQLKLRTEGKRSTLTPERQKTLDSIGFVWDSHAAFWEERLNELVAFRAEHGHANVPSKYKDNPQLAVWTKCQRRQFKLFCTKGPTGSNMSWERIVKLADLGFSFDPRIWKRNDRSDNPLSTYELLATVVPFRFQQPHQQRSPAKIRHSNSSKATVSKKSQVLQTGFASTTGLPGSISSGLPAIPSSSGNHGAKLEQTSSLLFSDNILSLPERVQTHPCTQVEYDHCKVDQMQVAMVQEQRQLLRKGPMTFGKELPDFLATSLEYELRP